MELVKEALEFHQVRVEKGIITRWALYRKMYGGSEDPYDYILVHLNDDFQKTEKVFPDKDMNETMNGLSELRIEINNEFWELVMATEPAKE
jgi:hypothetical protein